MERDRNSSLPGTAGAIDGRFPFSSVYTLLPQSDALQRFCCNITYQILISVAQSLSWSVLHRHLAKAAFLPPSWLLPYSPVAAFFPCPPKCSPHLSRGCGRLLGCELQYLTAFLPAFLVASSQWQMLLCFLAYVTPAPYLHSIDRIRILPERY